MKELFVILVKLAKPIFLTIPETFKMIILDEKLVTCIFTTCGTTLFTYILLALLSPILKIMILILLKQKQYFI